MKRFIIEQMHLGSDQQHLLFILFSRPIALVFRLIVQIRNWFYNKGILTATKLPGLTLSVGNLVAGGAGKTPVTITLCDWLTREGFNVVVLTRGYGVHIGKNSGMLLQKGGCIQSWGEPSDRIPDEARLISERVPEAYVLAGPDRKFLASQFKVDDPKKHLWILEDGFQHRQIARDVDIVLVDGITGFGNKLLLPAGPLREPMSSLGRASHVFLTKGAKASADIKEVGSGAQLVSTVEELSQPRRMCGPEVPMNGRAWVLAGIANSESFLSGVNGLGIEIANCLQLEDHEPLNSLKTKEYLAEVGRSDCPVLVTTEKDYWRDPKFFENSKLSVFVTPYSIKFDESLLRDCLVR